MNTKTQVFIPFTNNKVFTGAYRRGRYQPEFADWVRNTLGQVGGGYWGTSNSLKRDGINFWFKEPMHAMTFKLTWV